MNRKNMYWTMRATCGRTITNEPEVYKRLFRVLRTREVGCVMLMKWIYLA